MVRLARLFVVSSFALACGEPVSTDPVIIHADCGVTLDAGTVTDVGQVVDAGAQPDSCYLSRECLNDYVCHEEQCVPPCSNDEDCDQGEVCNGTVCVEGTRQTLRCTRHVECGTPGDLCVVEAGAEEGQCRPINQQSCRDDADCFFADSTASPQRGRCERGAPGGR